MRALLQIPLRLARFFLRAYRLHWFAAPASAIAAVVSTCSAAALMVLISPIVHHGLENGNAILVNAVVAPLIAYLLYLLCYYLQMFRRERKSLRDETGRLSQAKLSDWFRVVKYDYLAHLPSDTYLIALAGITQALLESQGTPIFWAVFASQFVDDLVTFLKEPAIWGGAKDIVAWENRENTTVWREAVSAVKRGEPRSKL